jgi:hypothetical protein
MDEIGERGCIAFEGVRRIASGELSKVALAAKRAVDKGQHAPILLFDVATSEPIELDFRGTADQVAARITRNAAGTSITGRAPEGEARRGPGRPKLGVIAREVTLLPRHWDWLNDEPGGASVALRKLVDEARRGSGAESIRRRAKEAAYRFMSAMAGNEPGFEEAARALFAGSRELFERSVRAWPPDIRVHALRLAARAFHIQTEAAKEMT